MYVRECLMNAISTTLFDFGETNITAALHAARLVVLNSSTAPVVSKMFILVTDGIVIWKSAKH